MREYRLLRQRGPESGGFLHDVGRLEHGTGGAAGESTEDSIVRQQRQAELKAREDQDRRTENPESLLEGDYLIYGSLKIERVVAPKTNDQFKAEEYLQELKDNMRELRLPIDDTVSQYIYRRGDISYMRCERPDGSAQLYEFSHNGPRLARQATSVAALLKEDSNILDSVPEGRQRIAVLVKAVAELDRDWAERLQENKSAKAPREHMDEAMQFFSENWEKWNPQTRSVICETINTSLADAGLFTRRLDVEGPRYVFETGGGEVGMRTYRPEYESVALENEDVPNDELPDGQRIISPEEQARINRALVDLRRAPVDVAAFNSRSRIGRAELEPHYRTVNLTGNTGPGPRDSALDPSWVDMKITLRSVSPVNTIALSEGVREAVGDLEGGGTSPAQRELTFRKLTARQVKDVLSFVVRWEATHQEALLDTGPFGGTVIRNRAEMTKIWDRLKGGQRSLLTELIRKAELMRGDNLLTVARLIEKLTPHICDCMQAGGPLDTQGRSDLAAALPELTTAERKIMFDMPLGRLAKRQFFPEFQS